MVLIKETTEWSTDFGGSIKNYNKKGLLIYESDSSTSITKKRKIEYDDTGRILREFIEETNPNSLNVDKFLLKCEYKESSKDYRIICYKSQTGNLSNLVLEEFIYGTKTFDEIDEIYEIREFKHKNDILISKKISNVNSNSTIKTLYEYNEKGFKIVETIYLSSDIPIIKHFKYENNVIVREEEYRIHNDNKYLAFYTSYTYDKDNNIIKTEKFGRFNSKFYLIKLKETIREDNQIITIEKGSLDGYMGYYDYDTLIQYLNQEGDNTSFLNHNFFDNRPLEDCHKYIEKIDHKGNLIERKWVNCVEESEIYEHKIYSNEYTDDGEIEIIIMFAIDQKTGLPIKQYVKRYFYED